MTTSSQHLVQLQTVRSGEFRTARDMLLEHGARPPLVIRGGTGSGKSVLLARLTQAARGAGLDVRPLSALLEEPTRSASGIVDRDTLFVADDADLQNDLASLTVDRWTDPRVRILVTASGSTPIDRWADVVVLHPLDAAEARDLVRERAPGAPPTIVDRVVDLSAGCVALLARGAAGLAAGQPGTIPSPTLELPEEYAGLRELFLALEPERRAFLALVAVRRTTTSGAVTDDVRAFLEPAGPSGVRFRSPVHATAVLSSSSPAETRAAHRAALIDDSLSERERAAHVAFGAEDSGAALSDWARDARNEPVSRRILAQLSAVEMADGAEATRRLGLAIAGAGFSGDFVLVEQLVADDRSDLRGDPDAMGGAAFARALAQGDAAGALDMLWRAVDLTDDPVVVERLLVALAVVNVSTVNETVEWERWRVAARRHPSPSVSRLTAAVTHGSDSSMTATDALAPSEGPLARHSPAEDLAESLVGAVCPELSWRSADLAVNGDDRLLMRSRIASTMSDLVEATRLIRGSKWHQALALIDLASRNTTVTGDRATTLGADAMRALVLAMSGEFETAGTAARRVLSDPMTARLPRAAVTARHALLHVAVQTGDDEGAFAAITAGEHFAFDGGAHPAAWMLDLADGVNRPGVPDELRSHRHDLVSASVRRCGTGERIAFDYLALMSEDGPSPGSLRRLLTTSRSSGYQYETARIRVTYGRALAASGDHRSATAELVAAVEAFDALGARGWAEHAAAAQRMLAESAPADRLYTESLLDLPVVDVPLTGQELRVAALAAAGLSNREIAERLTVSPRTVGGHLYNIFPKLGVRSRAGLRDALTRRDQRPSRYVPAS